MSFQSLSAELTGLLPGLSPFLADSFINRAWRDIRDERGWSFLFEDGAVICPTQVTAGTVSITQFTTTVTCDATASAALLAVGSTPGLTALQIRFGGTNAISVGQVYSITAVDQTVPAAIVLTLDRFVVEPTNATATYQVYRCYIRPPADDFLAWESLVDLANPITMTKENGRLTRTSTYFDMVDPQRMAQGLAYYLGAYKGDDALQNRPQYELWPHPTSGQTWYVRYRRQGVDFASPLESQPLIIPDDLILERAKGYHAYPWAAANVGHMPKLRGAAWVSLTVESKKEYQRMLVKAKRQDDEHQLRNVWNRGHGLRRGYASPMGYPPYPIDANFIQSHLVIF